MGLLMTTFMSPLQAAEISNPGFENDWEAWMEIDKDGKSAAISGDSSEGEKSAKLTSTAGSFGQLINVEPNTDYVLSAWVKGTGIVGVKMGKQLVYERQDKAKSWEKVEVAFNSGQFQQVAVFAQFNGKKSLFDDFSIAATEELIMTKNEDDSISFTTSNGVQIQNIQIFDVLGRQLFDENFSEEESPNSIKFDQIKRTIFIVKATLANGNVLTKKGLK